MKQDELASAVGLDRTALNKIESGVRKVTALELSDIANALELRMSAFFEDPPPAIVAHRSSQGLDTADSQIDAALASLAGEVEFLQSLGVEELQFPGLERVENANISTPETVADAEQLAFRARQLMDLPPDEPLTDLVENVAGLGLLAFSRDIGIDTADAGTILLRHGGVCFVNSHMKVGRRRLALSHELGHYLIADDYTIDWRVGDPSGHAASIESRIDRFARSLLLPNTAVSKLWRLYSGASGERAAAIRLASEFRVDMATLARRLRELGVVDGDSESLVRNTRTTRADILEMDLRIPLEELEGASVPRAYALGVIRLLRDERISRERALDLLQGTFTDADLPGNRKRRADEIWTFVS
ncbi:XRE family transcriptional regulator [Paeniglutamicibacter psychrophenolicus]|uniref:Zn-dependent peptidase ImmA (M78 family)/DNA-binding XRE family transcriptional regulator n=1 Tax=Paeniglutamicibacter psychrophenolicus TaxID=257454 RepID=A0ABS4WDW9_9MICC|nr:Zn-dependent peptidase ImmA (M78 family)/DNA-binding XRE family transcriptional regulator [Paeniglutamicibacter psychrophenolicus]